jgi:hypothetical protein
MPQAEIVTIYGENADPRIAVADVVEALERQLEKARAGEIVAVALAFTYFDASSGHQLAGMTGGSSKLIGETFRLMQTMSNA